MTTTEKLNHWLDILNEVSVILETYIACEDDKRRIKALDEVINDIYNLAKVMPLVEQKEQKND